MCTMLEQVTLNSDPSHPTVLVTLGPIYELMTIK